MLRGNLDKIAEHGKRADGIVKSMLEHSRGVSGERRVVRQWLLCDGQAAARRRRAGFSADVKGRDARSRRTINLALQPPLTHFRNSEARQRDY